MRLSDRVEHSFLRFVGELLSGRYTGPGRARLQMAVRGLTRDEGLPVARGLEDRLAKAVLGDMAHRGGLEPGRYVVGDRLREGSLMAPAVWKAVGPLRFTMASVDLLELLHDHPLEELPEQLPMAGSLGDELVFDLVCRSLGRRAPSRLLRHSPFTELSRARAGVMVPRLRDLPEGPAGLILRSRARELALAWRAAIRGAWALPPSDNQERVRALGAVFGAYLAGVMESRRYSLLTVFLRLYRRLLGETRAPEDVLTASGEATRSFRKVSQQESFLHAQAGLFQPGVALRKLEEELQRTPNMGREEEERLFHDEFQAMGRELIPRVEALHHALSRTLG